jgi:hypothetical protein
VKVNPLPIPVSFMLHGQNIEVVFDDSLCAREGNRGENHNGYNKIMLQSHVAGEPQPQSWIEQAFTHELVHDILFHMESEKNEDEKFVNLFASLLHQALTTAEYGGKRK